MSQIAYPGLTSNPDFGKAFLSLAADSMSRWEGQAGSDGQPLHLDMEWDSIRTLQELEILETTLQARLDTWIVEATAEGMAEAAGCGPLPQKAGSHVP